MEYSSADLDKQPIPPTFTMALISLGRLAGSGVRSADYAGQLNAHNRRFRRALLGADAHSALKSFFTFVCFLVNVESL
jgi:hypothetical protein